MTPLEFTSDGLLVYRICGGTGDDYFDPRPLIANLAMAGALCESFARGIYYAAAHVLVTQWEPNVDGRAVPR